MNKEKLFWILNFTNLWLFKIGSQSFFLVLVLACASYIFFQFSIHKKVNKKLLILSFLIVAFLQVKTSDVKNMTTLTNEDINLRDTRLRAYPPVKIGLFNRLKWIPAGHYLESRNEARVFYALKENALEVLDPNLYFFANHPRQKVGSEEFEKFAYLLLPFFLIGTYNLFNSGKKKQIVLAGYLIFCLFIFAIVGNKNPYGPFLFFPFIITATCLGITKGITFFEKPYHQNNFKIAFFAIYSLVLIQQISYQYG